ncbi:60S ribosomal protein L38 [Purpureocillium lavendulum]|uniref:60S ribosomal protein L38 n=1 Tax=Purpureocillium lavendulum TaxID=1247861 RepID=A0AB34FIZ7_9HYPO|nr:60S ribosomal protein L38 [Purpureocillium lavendulum]
MVGLPPGWESDYDGQRWFYTYKASGHIQYHFPSEGDEFPDFVDASVPAPDLAPEERLESQQQLRRQTTTTTSPHLSKQLSPPSPHRAGNGAAKPGMSATARPVSAIWEGDGGGDEDAEQVFQPENFMFLGPGTYTEVSPLNEEEEEAARRVVAGGIGERVADDANVAGRSAVGKTVSPVASNVTTPMMQKSEASSSPAPPSAQQIVVESPPIQAEPPTTLPPQEAQHQQQPVVHMIDSREMPHELPVPPHVFDPVGVMAEMATEHTGVAHIELHPDPVEIADNSILAPIETIITPPVTGMAELPERNSPVELKMPQKPEKTGAAASGAVAAEQKPGRVSQDGAVNGHEAQTRAGQPTTETGASQAQATNQQPVVLAVESVQVHQQSPPVVISQPQQGYQWPEQQQSQGQAPDPYQVVAPVQTPSPPTQQHQYQYQQPTTVQQQGTQAPTQHVQQLPVPQPSPYVHQPQQTPSPGQPQPLQQQQQQQQQQYPQPQQPQKTQEAVQVGQYQQPQQSQQYQPPEQAQTPPQAQYYQQPQGFQQGQQGPPAQPPQVYQQGQQHQQAQSPPPQQYQHYQPPQQPEQPQQTQPTAQAQQPQKQPQYQPLPPEQGQQGQQSPPQPQPPQQPQQQWRTEWSQQTQSQPQAQPPQGDPAERFKITRKPTGGLDPQPYKPYTPGQEPADAPAQASSDKRKSNAAALQREASLMLGPKSQGLNVDPSTVPRVLSPAQNDQEKQQPQPQQQQQQQQQQQEQQQQQQEQQQQQLAMSSQPVEQKSTPSTPGHLLGRIDEHDESEVVSEPNATPLGTRPSSIGSSLPHSPVVQRQSMQPSPAQSTVLPQPPGSTAPQGQGQPPHQGAAPGQAQQQAAHAQPQQQYHGHGQVPQMPQMPQQGMPPPGHPSQGMLPPQGQVPLHPGAMPGQHFSQQPQWAAPQGTQPAPGPSQGANSPVLKDKEKDKKWTKWFKKSLAAAEKMALEGANESQDSQAIFDAHQALFGVGTVAAQQLSSSPIAPRLGARAPALEQGTSVIVQQGAAAGHVGAAASDSTLPPTRLDTTAQKQALTDPANHEAPADDGAIDDRPPIEDSLPTDETRTILQHDVPTTIDADDTPSLTTGKLPVPQRKMDQSQDTPTQVNEDRDYSAIYAAVPSSPTDKTTQQRTGDTRTLQEGDTGAVNFSNFSDHVRPSSQASEDGGFDTTRGEWRTSDGTSQLNPNAAYTPYKPHELPPETPALPKNPFAAKPNGAVPFAASQLFAQTQQVSSAVKASPTSSRPSPNLFLNSISPNVFETSPLKNRANVSSPTDIRTSSPTRLHEIPATVLKIRPGAAIPEEDGAEKGLSKEDLIPESPTLKSRATMGREPLSHYEPMKESQERKTSGDGQDAAVNSDEDSDDAFTRRGSKLGRSFRQSITSSHRGPRLFDGMAFALSFLSAEQEQQRSKLESRILQAGGMILKDGFQELFDQPATTSAAGSAVEEAEPLRLTKTAVHCGFTALIADRHSRTAKFMQALALGLPCLAPRWITSCLDKGEILRWEPYLLSAGVSAVLGQATRSRLLMPYPAAEATLVDVMDHSSKLLQDQTVLVVADTKKMKKQTRQQYLFLVQALGPAHLSRVTTADQARTALRECEKSDAPFDWLYVDESVGTVDAVLAPPRETGSKKRKKAAAQAPIGGYVRVLTDELVIQSLILGEMVDQEDLEP